LFSGPRTIAWLDSRIIGGHVALIPAEDLFFFCFRAQASESAPQRHQVPAVFSKGKRLRRCVFGRMPDRLRMTVSYLSVTYDVLNARFWWQLAGAGTVKWRNP
jgi:hypothetical protein